MGASCTLSLNVIRAAFDLQAESRSHLRDRRETPGRLWTVRVTTVVLLQTPKGGKRKEKVTINNLFQFYRFSRHIRAPLDSLALVGFGEKWVFMGFLGVPALTRDSRGCFVDFAPVVLSTTPKTISGVAGAWTTLGRLGYRIGKRVSTSYNDFS